MACDELRAEKLLMRFCDRIEVIFLGVLRDEENKCVWPVDSRWWWRLVSVRESTVWVFPRLRYWNKLIVVWHVCVKLSFVMWFFESDCLDWVWVGWWWVCENCEKKKPPPRRFRVYTGVYMRVRWDGGFCFVFVFDREISCVLFCVCVLAMWLTEGRVGFDVWLGCFYGRCVLRVFIL